MKRFYICLIFIVGCFSLFAQVDGVWENGGRFVEFTNDGFSKSEMRIILKPYFKYVYDNAGKYETKVERVDNYDGLYLLNIKYPMMRKSVWLPICVQGDFLFTSFYQRADYSSSVGDVSVLHNSPLYGLWLEQGTRNGILLYPNEAPEWIDAYFFTDDEYFKFRYWLDDFEYNQKMASFSDSKGVQFKVPRLLKRGNLVYSCVTANSSVLRNYEKGVFFVKRTADGFSLTISPQGAGSGTHASADTYPNQQYPVVIDLPLHITADGKIFSYGEPFLSRSKITDLDAEIVKHNSLKKPKPEPQLVPDELDFHLDELKKAQELIAPRPQK